MVECQTTWIQHWLRVPRRLTWARIHKAPKENLKLKWKFQMHISNLFSIILQWNFACLWKTMFFISMQSFIEVLWVKIEKSAFEIFTQIWDFPKELCEYGPWPIIFFTVSYGSRVKRTVVGMLLFYTVSALLLRKKKCKWYGQI